jgi:phosphonate transport system substrate-binding protein
MIVRRKLPQWCLMGLLFTWILIFSACGRSTPAPTPTPTLQSTPTPEPTRTPTPFPLASPDNPLVLGIVSETNDPKAAAAADDIVAEVARITNFTVTSMVYSSTNVLLADFQANKVHIVFLQPFTYIWAKQRGLAQVMLLTNHFGVYQYGGQFLANVTSKFTIYFDPAKDQNTVDAATALKQFNGKRPCWVDPTSAAGYVVPLGLLANNDVKVKDGVLTQNYTSVVRALYITGICDFGATFATTGDPRTSIAVTQDLTDVMNRIVSIYKIDPIIPNLNLSVQSSLPKDIREDLAFAMQSLAHSEKGKASLATATAYEITDLKTVDDTFYDPLRNLLGQSGVSLDTLIGK